MKNWSVELSFCCYKHDWWWWSHNCGGGGCHSDSSVVVAVLLAVVGGDQNHFSQQIIFQMDAVYMLKNLFALTSKLKHLEWILLISLGVSFLFLVL